MNRKDPIAQSLRTSAQNLSPSYSEHLHQRTMRAIRAQQTCMTLQPRPTWHRAIAVAALLLLCVTLWYSISSRRPTAPPQVALRGPVVGIDVNIPDAGDLIRHGSAPLKDAFSGIDGNGLADLEQDARSLAHFIANQLPQSDPRFPPRSNQQKPPAGT